MSDPMHPFKLMQLWQEAASGLLDASTKMTGLAMDASLGAWSADHARSSAESSSRSWYRPPAPPNLFEVWSQAFGWGGPQSQLPWMSMFAPLSPAAASWAQPQQWFGMTNPMFQMLSPQLPAWHGAAMRPLADVQQWTAMLQGSMALGAMTATFMNAAAPWVARTQDWSQAMFKPPGQLAISTSLRRQSGSNAQEPAMLVLAIPVPAQLLTMIEAMLPMSGLASGRKTH